MITKQHYKIADVYYTFGKKIISNKEFAATSFTRKKMLLRLLE